MYYKHIIIFFATIGFLNLLLDYAILIQKGL